MDLQRMINGSGVVATSPIVQPMRSERPLRELVGSIKIAEGAAKS